MKAINNTDAYLKKIRPELRKYTLNLLKEVDEKDETSWTNRINVCIRSGSLLGEIDDYLRAIKEISQKEEYSHLVSDSALEDIKKISKNIESVYDLQRNTLYYPKEKEFEPLDNLEVDMTEYNKNGAFKNVIHYHCESNGKTRDGTLFLRDDELSDLLESIEAHDNKTESLKYYRKKIKSRKAAGKRIILSTSDKEILKNIEFDGIIPKNALTPQNHTQMIDENIIHYKNGSLLFTNFGYNLLQKVNELY